MAKKRQKAGPSLAKKKAGARTPAAARADNSKAARVYEHTEEKLLLRPDVGLQAQFKVKKPARTFRYDPNLDPALAWDISADRERGEALIARIEDATDLATAKAAAGELRRMSRPFLNWAGKAERSSFELPTLPLFIHERLSTQAILQSVRSHKRDRQQSLAFFADEELDVADRLLKAYEHETPWVNRLILGDSLVVMNSLLQYEGLGGQVQAIYMDPPYGVRFGSNFQPFVRRRDVKHGDDVDMTREPEMVQAYRDTWELGLHSYLTYLRDRLLLCRELLHVSGSVFVQMSDENVHHVRELMDEVFGAENFTGLVVVQKTGGLGTSGLKAVADYLLWYAKDAERLKYRRLFRRKLLGVGEGTGERYDQLLSPDGKAIRPMTPDERENPALVPAGWRAFQLDNLTSGAFRENTTVPFTFEGETFHPGDNACWRTTVEGLDRLATAKRIQKAGRTLRYRRFLDDFPAFEITNVWDDVAGAPDKIYVVQTSASVIQRCVLMATDPGDLVLDPTCGSGTTAYVAEQWGRRWITVDTSRVPLALARQRLLTATFPYFELRDARRGPASGFVYRRRQNFKGEEVGGIVPHVTLRSVAHDEPPAEEILVDRPEVESGVTRVTGPFVVEATIPTANGITPARAVAEETREFGGDVATRMIEVLRRSPTLRLTGGQAVALASIRRPARAMSLHAEAELAEGGKRVALVFGPESGPVTEQMVFAAAREANLKSYDRLFVVGFAIQPGAQKLIQNCEAMVGLPATYVQATMDLLMGDLLKTTRASQIFSVTGAPDIRLLRLKRKNGNGPLYRVELRGLDVFDPVTMRNDHRNGDDVPAWFLDSDHDDLVFHVAQAFFPRTSAWEGLKRALRATYEESVWEHLAGTASEPFSAGEHRRVAVKVIDDRGNELMVVRSLDEAEAER